MKLWIVSKNMYIQNIEIQLYFTKDKWLNLENSTFYIYALYFVNFWFIYEIQYFDDRSERR